MSLVQLLGFCCVVAFLFPPAGFAAEGNPCLQRAYRKANQLECRGKRGKAGRKNDTAGSSNPVNSSPASDPEPLAQTEVLPVKENLPPAPVRRNGIFFDVEAGAQTFFWRPAEINGLSFKTEGLRAYSFSAGIGINKLAQHGLLLTVSYKAPLEKTARQNDMLSSSEQKSTGLEQYTLGISPDSLVYALSPALYDNALLRILLSTKYSYSRTKFYGQAMVSETFYYAGPGWYTSNGTTYGGKYLYSGQTIDFNTEFTEQEISSAVHGMSDGRHEVRICAFAVDWSRPSADNAYWRVSNGMGNGGYYHVVYDTRFVSKGIGVKLVSKDMSSPGFNVNLAANLGLQSHITQVPVYDTEHLRFTELTIGGCYNWYLFPEKKEGLFISVGGNAVFDSWTITSRMSNEDPYETPLDKDSLYSVYLRAGLKF